MELSVNNAHTGKDELNVVFLTHEPDSTIIVPFLVNIGLFAFQRFGQVPADVYITDS